MLERAVVVEEEEVLRRREEEEAEEDLEELASQLERDELSSEVKLKVEAWQNPAADVQDAENDCKTVDHA